MAAGRKTGGRKKGTPNKLTGEVKAMILAALDKVGGVDYLARQANENPGPFLSLVGRVMPLQLGNYPSSPLPGLDPLGNDRMRALLEGSLPIKAVPAPDKDKGS